MTLRTPTQAELRTHASLHADLSGRVARLTLTLHLEHPEPLHELTINLPIDNTFLGLEVTLNAHHTMSRVAPRERTGAPRRLTSEHLHVPLGHLPADTPLTVRLHTLRLLPISGSLTAAHGVRPHALEIALRGPLPAFRSHLPLRTELRHRSAHLTADALELGTPDSALLDIERDTNTTVHTARDPHHEHAIIALIDRPLPDARTLRIDTGGERHITSIALDDYARLVYIIGPHLEPLVLIDAEGHAISLELPEPHADCPALPALWDAFRLRALETDDVEANRELLLDLSTRSRIATSLTAHTLELPGGTRHTIALPPAAYAAPELAGRGFLERVARLDEASLDRLIAEADDGVAFLEELAHDMSEARQDSRNRLETSRRYETTWRERILRGLADGERDATLRDALGELEKRRARSERLERRIHKLDTTLEEAQRKRSLLAARAQRSQIERTLNQIRKQRKPND